MAAITAGWTGNASAAPVPVVIYVGGQDGRVVSYDGSTTTTLSAAGVLAPVQALAIGSDGALYAAAFNYVSAPPPNTEIARYNGSAFSHFANATAPFGNAFAKTNNGSWSVGDLFVSNSGSASASKFDSTGTAAAGAVPTIPAGGADPTPSPVNMLFNPAGSLLYINKGAGGSGLNAVYTWDGTTLNTLIDATHGTPLGATPTGMAFDEFGNLFIAEGGTVIEYNAATGVAITGNPFLTGGPQASITGLAYDGAGTLYVTDQGLNTVNRYDAVTGAYIDTFFTGSGALSGLVVVPVPEPAHVLTAVFGVLAFGGLLLRRRSQSAQAAA